MAETIKINLALDRSLLSALDRMAGQRQADTGVICSRSDIIRDALNSYIRKPAKKEGDR
jgi:metal-responsive CopG/Arc/MetJ family transcriptional regulator